MFAVILHKRGGIRCEILWKMSGNAGTPPNIHVKIGFSNSRKNWLFKIEFLKFISSFSKVPKKLDFFQNLKYNISKLIEKIK